MIFCLGLGIAICSDIIPSACVKTQPLYSMPVNFVTSSSWYLSFPFSHISHELYAANFLPWMPVDSRVMAIFWQFFILLLFLLLLLLFFACILLVLLLFVYSLHAIGRLSWQWWLWLLHASYFLFPVFPSLMWPYLLNSTLLIVDYLLLSPLFSFLTEQTSPLTLQWMVFLAVALVISTFS